MTTPEGSVDTPEHSDSEGSADTPEHSDSEDSETQTSASELNGLITNYRPHCSEVLLDQVIRLYKSLPINSPSGRRLYEHDICETLFVLLDERLGEVEAKSFWLWEELAPVLFDQLGSMMKPLSDWGSHDHPLPKRRLTAAGLEGVIGNNPIQNSFRVMMTFICRLLPESGGSRTVDEFMPPLISSRTSWYGAVFGQWVAVCLLTTTNKSLTAPQLAQLFREKIFASGLDQSPSPTCTIDWNATRLDWVAAAHHTLRFAECVQRLADVLLRVNVEATEDGWAENHAGRVEPVDVLLQFLPTWIHSDERPEVGDVVVLCDGVDRRTCEIELELCHLPPVAPAAWLEWGAAVLKRILV